MPDNPQTPCYRKELKKLNKRYRSIDNDLLPVIQQLEAGEIPGDRISGNRYAVYKLRVKNSDNNKGQSGGYRVIYYTLALDLVLLTTIYSKSDLADISNKEIEEIIAKYELETSEKAKETESSYPDGQ
jgi:mRNA-degrading endonuclease RelE of RelBE toxin-antitoxin system